MHELYKNKTLTEISSLISTPVVTNLRIFIIFCILFFAPDFIYRLVVIPQFLFAIFHLSYSIGYSIAYSYILCVILTLLNERIKKYIGAILVFGLWLITTLELYVIFFVKTRFTPFVLQVVSETNSRESSEFISAYITKTPVIV